MRSISDRRLLLLPPVLLFEELKAESGILPESIVVSLPRCWWFTKRGIDSFALDAEALTDMDAKAEGPTDVSRSDSCCGPMTEEGALEEKEPAPNLPARKMLAEREESEGRDVSLV